MNLNVCLSVGRVEKRYFIRLFNIFMADKDEVVKGYCVKCRDKAGRVMTNAKEVEMKGKGGATRRAMTGICEKCGTKMFKILGNKK